MQREPIDLDTIRARLAGTGGKQFWRSLEELADTPQFRTFLHREFPRNAAEMGDPVHRRQFLKLMGAALAMAGLSACAAPQEKIVPFVAQPNEALVPGQPLYFSTAMPRGGYGVGVLAESNQGRPTKIEGNPTHPASLGATDIFAQASVLGLYDPDRAQAVTNNGETSSWEAFVAALQSRLATLRERGGAGLRILTETITSPTLGAQIQALLQAFPQAQWHQYEPFGRDNERQGARLAFGQDVQTTYRFDQARVIVSLDADFLSDDPGHLRYARQFADERRVRAGQAAMNRLYVVESTPTITGAMADHRLALRPTMIEQSARALAGALGVAGVAANIASITDVPAGWLDALVRDLQAQRGASIVIAGPSQPPAVHALVHAINAALGNIGATVVYTQPVEVNPTNQWDSLQTLTNDIAAGNVDTLLITESNPALTAPADLQFAERLRAVPFAAHLSLYYDETAKECSWHIPQAHYLEAWGDVRAFDGTASLIQPLVQPLRGGRTAHELLAAVSGDTAQTAYEIVRTYWQNRVQTGDFEPFWRQALHDGIVAGTAAAVVQPTLAPNLATQVGQAPAPSTGNLDVIFRPDPTIDDGRFANNAWLQELPKPLTTITWGNPVLVSPATAARLQLQSQDVVELTFDGRTMRAPVWIAPGHADDAATLFVGYGRSVAGSVAAGVGFNAYALRPANARWFGTNATLRKIDAQEPIASVQNQFTLDGRDLVRAGTLAEFRSTPTFARNEHDDTLPIGQRPAATATAKQPPAMFPPRSYTGHAWGMSIDINTCIGCNACTIACQAENNIPTVGKAGVQAGRIMHWIKVDRYYAGELDNPETYFQPRPCMHCETAPCEVVCPVEATLHDSEGINNMVYNRCIGTRYCSNNCPYKVRRFNFFEYNQDIPLLNLVRNPEVTVRNRGVMEKCSYCIQRIERTRIESEKESRQIRDGEVQTACQQACPTNAIVFGDINDAQSQVAQLKAQPLTYGMLAELGTQPRTTYMARLRNPNPEIKET